MSTFIPNSVQVPSLYMDKYMAFLTGDEWKVLSYAVRRIFGFQMHENRITLAQFARGTRDKQGTPLDYGSGVNEDMCRKCLASLVEYGLILRVKENDALTNRGVLWSLQLDPNKVDDGAILAAHAARGEQCRAKTEAARNTWKRMTSVSVYDHLMSDTTPSLSATPTPPPCQQPPPPSLSATPTKDKQLDKQLDKQIGPANAGTDTGDTPLASSHPKKTTPKGSKQASLATNPVAQPSFVSSHPKKTTPSSEPTTPKVSLNGSNRKPTSFVSGTPEKTTPSSATPPSNGGAVTKDHPAIVACRQANGAYPKKSLWLDLAEQLGEQPDIAVLTYVCTKWDKKGFNPMNLDGKLDWYRQAMGSADPLSWEPPDRRNGIPQSRHKITADGKITSLPDNGAVGFVRAV